MERKIGEIFEYNGEWFQCVEGLYCNDCAFVNDNCEDRERITIREKLTKQPTTGFCNSEKRNDRKSVIFKKLKKIGEPYVAYGKVRQKYKLHAPLTITNGIIDKDISCDDVNGIVDIEIKQNKEDMKKKRRASADTINGINHGIEPMSSYYKKDMEENKVKISRGNADYLISKLQDILADHLHGGESDEVIAEFEKFIDASEKPSENIEKNLKPFSLELAKQGKPVCTRDGRKARIICWDRRLFYKNVSYPILALVERSDGEDDVCGYNEKGKVLIEDGAEYKDDLMMLPEKKEGWVNVYKDGLLGARVYKTRKEAYDIASPCDYVDTVKISWEE